MDGNTATTPYYTNPETDSLMSAGPSGGDISIAQKLNMRKNRNSTNQTNTDQNQQRNNYENAPMGGAAPLATSSISKTLLGA